jgi:hypothetical protein
MDSRVRAIVVAAALGMALLACGGAAASTGAPAAALSRHAWGKAIEVPGTVLSGVAGVNSVSCASAGNCSAGGGYIDSSARNQVFVVSQVNDVWGKAIEVPGTAALNQGDFAEINSVSCGSAANCSAGGEYTDSSRRVHAFVVSQVNGTWGKAIEVSGIAALNRGRHAAIGSVSCASAGNCSAGGGYIDSSGHGQAFVVSQVNGAWGKAIEVPGTAALNQRGNAEIDSVSCASAGNCSAGGGYTDNSGHGQVFVVSQVNGAWGKAIEVPGTAALNRGGNADIDSVSCASAGNCSAGGIYADVPGQPNSDRDQAFVVSQVNGVWGKAMEVPGTAALNQGGNAEVTSVSCASAGNCSAGGFYKNSSRHTQAFVANQVNGTWHTAIKVPGIGTLNHGGNAYITSVSCASAGECSAGGPTAGGDGAFVVSET